MTLTKPIKKEKSFIFDTFHRLIRRIKGDDIKRGYRVETVNFKHLHYFWMVAHQGSIARASESLNITPQTISGQLSLLEERFDCKLFERVGRGLELTEMGRLVLQYADDIFALGNELATVLRGMPTVGPIKLIVSSASGLPKTIVYKTIEPALSLPNGLNLTSLEGPIHSILADLVVHDVDLVLSDTPATGTLSINVHNHLLGEAGLTFFATKTLAEQYQQGFPLSLHNAPMLLPTQQHEVRQLVDRWLGGKQVFPEVRGEFDDSALIKSFGKAGLGIFFMPSIIADEVCHNFQVEIIGETNEVKQRFYAISAERKISNPAVNAIIESAQQLF